MSKANKYGYYSILQYQPNHNREERCNVGVVLVEKDNDEGYYGICLTERMSRCQRFFVSDGEDFNPDNIIAELHNIESLLDKNNKDLHSMIKFQEFVNNLKYNLITMTNPKQTIFLLQDKYTEDEKIPVEELFDQLVLP